MNNLVLPFLVILIMLTSCSSEKNESKNDKINPVLGDISYLKATGFFPTKSTDENIRIRTHLEYVESLLKQKDVSHLPIQLQINRKKHIDHLHEYIVKGQFPKNYDHVDERRPC